MKLTVPLDETTDEHRSRFNATSIAVHLFPVYFVSKHTDIFLEWSKYRKGTQRSYVVTRCFRNEMVFFVTFALYKKSFV